MAQSVPTTEPVVIIAGDTATWLKTLADYPASEGWSLSYTLAQSLTRHTVTAVASGDAYRVTIAAATTANFAAGLYYWQARISKAGEVFTLFEGELTVRAALAAAAAGYDPRSQAQKALDQLKAALADYTASQGHISEYEIAGRRMRFRNAGEILTLLSFWERELVNETAAQRMAAGQDAGRQIFVRF